MAVVLTLVTGVVIAAIIYFGIVVPTGNVRRMKNIPSPKTWPILGNSVEMWSAQYEFNKVLDRWQTHYGTRLVVWLTFWFPMVILGNAKDVRKVLSSRDHVKKGMFYKAFNDAIGTGAFNCPVDIWKQRRPHLEKAFHSKVLSKMFLLFDTAGNSLVEVLKEDCCDGQVFDIHKYFNRCSMQMIFGPMGADFKPLEERTGERDKFWQTCIDYYNSGTYFAEYRMLRPWFLVSDFLWKLTPYAKELLDQIHWSEENVYFKIINQRREVIAKSKEILEEEDRMNNNECLGDKTIVDKNHPIFLDLLLKLQKTSPELNLTDKDIAYELSSLYIAGHDASGKSMSFATLFVGLNPECQEKVISELNEIFGEDRERPVTEDDLGRMKYLECCIKEALRLMPPVSMITRTTGSDIHLDDEATIPKGTEVAIATYLVHRDPAIYPNPEVFLPDRFFPENSKGRDPYSWIPFSSGPRGCLGPKFAMMEVKAVLAHLFRNFRVESVDPLSSWKLNTNVTLKLEGGWNVKLHPR